MGGGEGVCVAKNKKRLNNFETVLLARVLVDRQLTADDTLRKPRILEASQVAQQFTMVYGTRMNNFTLN